MYNCLGYQIYMQIKCQMLYFNFYQQYQNVNIIGR